MIANKLWRKAILPSSIQITAGWNFATIQKIPKDDVVSLFQPHSMLHINKLKIFGIHTFLTLCHREIIYTEFCHQLLAANVNEFLIGGIM